MNLLWRTRLTALGASSLAIVLGLWLADGNYGAPLLLCGIAGAACVVALSGVQLDTAVLGGLLFGYIVGNRGFAQFSLLPGLPALPAEVGLVVCSAWLVVASAMGRRLPFQRDALNFFVILWIVIGSIRIIPDLRAYGIVALRDFATVYYATFFFIAQAQSSREASRRFLERCLLAAIVVVIPLAELFRHFPEFFLGTLVFAGIPFIYFKGDLLATFMAVGIVIAHRRWEASRRVIWLLIALGGFVGVLITSSRASLLGLLTAIAWLAISRRTMLLRTLLGATLAGALIFIGAIAIEITSSRDNFAFSVYERALSIADISGHRSYVNADIESKGDNNRFRMIWWQAAVEETIDGNPWFGLGFGHDLAAGFIRRYYPEHDEEFSARSPHCIFVTIFGRMGAIGLIAFLGIVAVMCCRTWSVLHASVRNEAHATAWVLPWVVLVSAAFGVVLEGPMGAVIFWSLLGMAAGTQKSIVTETPTLPDAAQAPAGMAAIHG